MILIQLQDVTKRFGGRYIFRDFSWTVSENARIGLVGTNGAGKSTLLRIAHQLEAVDSGEVSRRRGLVTAYLPQKIAEDSRSAMEVVVGSREDLARAEAELEDIESRLASSGTAGDLVLMERLLAQQEQAIRRYEELGGPGVEGEARARLLDLGLTRQDIYKPLTTLSGGQRKLVYLAGCLTQRPDLLLLDEPETHLDLKARQQLEELIGTFTGATVVVSHDRYLLDETVSEIAELENGNIATWQGNYSAYAVEREIALQRQQILYATQQKEIARLEEAIARFKLWASQVVDERHIKQARNKQRQIDSMEKVERPVLERRKIKLRLGEKQRSGQKVVDVVHASVSFDRQTVLDNAVFTVWRGERVGVIGANGAGKTVLIQLILGLVPARDSVVWIGPSVSLGHFAQHEETLPRGSTPVDLIRDVRPMREDQAVSHLMKFLFRYDQIRQRVESLSGGERTRLQLLMLMLGEANCLVLDEPTNHLDIESLEVLEAALEDYPGTVIVVSHDRYFLDRIVDRTLEVSTGRVTSRDGGYSAWLQSRSAEEEPVRPVPPKARVISKSSSAADVRR
jgi:ATP-binding cassette, subfamily F, member 3